MKLSINRLPQVYKYINIFMVLVVMPLQRSGNPDLVVYILGYRLIQDERPTFVSKSRKCTPFLGGKILNFYTRVL